MSVSLRCNALQIGCAYDKELYETKCATLFEHVYEAYRGDGGSVFADADA